MTTPDGGQSTANDAQSGVAGTQQGGESPESTGQSTGEGQQSTGSGSAPAEPTVSRADFERLQSQLSAADKKRNEAEAALRQLTDKDLPELDKLKRDLADQTKRADEANSALGQLRIETAFLKDNTKAWRNPGTALKLLDLSKVTIDSDGNVMGMKDAVEALAKSDPYLLEDKKANEPEEPPVGGTIPGTNGKQGQQSQSKQQMAARFPATRTRGIG